eukprot:7121135-Alexandrium_andersonii.AAC.1
MPSVAGIRAPLARWAPGTLGASQSSRRRKVQHRRFFTGIVAARGVTRNWTGRLMAHEWLEP